MNASQFKLALTTAVEIVTESIRRGHPQGNPREHLLAQALVTMRSRVIHLLANPVNAKWVERKGAADGTENILESLHNSWIKLRTAAMAPREAPPADEAAAHDATTVKIQTSDTARLTIQERRILELHPQLVAYITNVCQADPEARILLAEVDKVVE